MYFTAPKVCDNLAAEFLWWTSFSQEPYAPRFLFTHRTLLCRISCLDILVFPQYDPDDVTMGLSSPPPSSEATILLTWSRLSTPIFITTLIYYCLYSFSSSCRAVYLSLYPLYEWHRIKTGGDIYGWIHRATSGTGCKIVAVCEDSRIFSNYLATLGIPLELLE